MVGHVAKRSTLGPECGYEVIAIFVYDEEEKTYLKRRSRVETVLSVKNVELL